jgi:NADH-quinone oxidoreductase subunit J
MLVGVDSADSLKENIKFLRPIAITAAVGIGGLLISLIGRATTSHDAYGLAIANQNGNVQGLAQLLFTKYVWAFEVISALLITAALGAMVLAHSQKLKSKFSQRDLSVARFRRSKLETAAGLPGPGVYALHNAVDVPARLPDGSAASSSISRVLEARGDVLSSKEFELTENKEERD